MKTMTTAPITRQDLRAIALRARTLDERLADAHRSQADAFGEPALERWRNAAGGAEKLRRRLAVDGYDERDARRALGSLTAALEYDPPPWAKLLGEMLNTADDRDMTPIELFRRQTVRRLGPCEALTPPAIEALERRLTLNLKTLFEPALKTAGKRARSAGFFRDFFEEYSVLARRLVRLCDTWIESTRELDRRLATDRDLLAVHFGVEGELTGLRAGLSDRHHGGRQVCELLFASGSSVMYKPRALDAEAAFNSFLEHLSPRLGQSTPPQLKVYLRDGYGWMETTVHSPLADLEQARIAFQRAGSLLFLTWLLGVDDLHTGNVVATAEGPVVVDLETILQNATGHGPKDRGSAEGALLRARRRLDDSFLSTGLLSFHRKDPEGRFFEIGGLLGFGEHNRFRLQDKDLHPEDFRDQIEQGFEQAYRAVLDSAPSDPWTEGFRSVRPRRVLRSSQGYAYLLGRLNSLESLRDGFSAGLVLESLDGDPDEVRAEKASLQDLDIPTFKGNAEAGMAAVQKRWRGLNKKGLRQQLEILRAALGPRKAVSAGSKTGQEGTETTDELSTALRFARRLRDAAILGDDGAATWLTTSSVRITGRRDRGMSYHLYDGGVGIAVFLAALARVTGDEQWADLARAALRPIDAVLASPRRDELIRRESIGACSGLGSIVYGATLVSQLLDDPQALETGRRTARLITPERIAADDRFDVEGGAAGAVLGLRALHRIDPQAWVHERMILCAEHVADHLHTPGDGMAPGFAHGASGMAYALLAVAELDDGSRWLAAARDALRLERRFYDPSRKNWLAADGTARIAWCHGAPGIALGRFAAYGRIDEPWVESELRIALETTWHRTKAALETTWHRTKAEPRMASETTWHRARGGVKTGLDAQSVPEAGPELGPEHLCCGRFGRLDLLLEAGRRFDRPDLVEAARSIGRQRLQARTTFAEEESYGFFRGISGLGYTLLRLRENPGAVRLPSVLAFETMEDNP